jgi:hypothetical protein
MATELTFFFAERVLVMVARFRIEALHSDILSVDAIDILFLFL